MSPKETSPYMHTGSAPCAYGFNIRSMIPNIIDTSIYETVCHRKTNKPNGLQILIINIFPPVKGNITAFHNLISENKHPYPGVPMTIFIL